MEKNWEHAAGVLWPILVKAADGGQKLNYSDIAPQIETNPLSVRMALEPIQAYCMDNKLPPLTAVVVNKANGLPGTGFIAWNIDSLDEAYVQVNGFNWKSLVNPFGGFGLADTTKSFAKALLEGPDLPGEVYSKVRVRGIAQKTFRVALLAAYNCKCAMCGFSFEGALEAAHIIPWSECDHSLRIAIRNGMLLCANHHKLFDSGHIRVNAEYKIECSDESFEYRPESLNGQRLRLPVDKRYFPDPDLLEKHRQRK